MVDVLLVQPPIQDFYLTSKRTVPYGLACIAAALKRAGFAVALFDGLATPKSKPIARPAEMAFLDRYYGTPDLSPFALFHQFQHFGYSYQHIGKVARDSGAFLVGISASFSAYSESALKTAETVKTWLPSATVVLGGHHPTTLPEAVIGHPAVDFVLRGEGEVSMPDLARCLKAGGEVDRVPGIAYQPKTGPPVVTPPAIMSDPDSYPLPADELINHKFYRRGRHPAVTLVTSRGCPMRCSYCSVAAWPYRRRSVPSVMAELRRAILERQARFVDFEDENLSLDPAWFSALLDGITSEFGHLPLELRAMNGLFAPTLSKPIITKMKIAGFKTLNLSVGSSDPCQQKRFNRPHIRSAVARVAENARAEGLDVVGYVIVGAPGQAAASSVDDLLFLADLGILAGVSPYYPAPGSADYKRLGEENELPPAFGLMRASTLPVFSPATRTERATLLRLGRVLNFMKRLEALRRKDALEAMSGHERIGIGHTLLHQFFRDGRIRGVRPDGSVYVHEVSSRLTGLFLQGISRHEPPPDDLKTPGCE